MQLERLAKTLTASLVAAVALSACAPNVTAPALPSQVRTLQADFDACAGSVNGRLDAVVNTYYPDFKRGKFVSVVFPRAARARGRVFPSSPRQDAPEHELEELHHLVLEAAVGGVGGPAQRGQEVHVGDGASDAL